jgi:cytoskeleton protein RodZ
MARKSKQAEQAEITDTTQANADVYATLADNASPNHTNCGSAMRDSREKQGLSVNEVATRLRLSVKQIQAIESDNFAALPEATIVRGFIRNYAKLLKIPAEPLLTAYHALVPDKAPLPFSVKPTSSMRVSEYQKPKTGRYVALGLAVLMGLGAWFFYQNYIQKPNPTTPTVGTTMPDATSAGTGEALPEVALPAAERENAAPVAPGTEIVLPNTAAPTSAAEPTPAATSVTVPPAASTTPTGAATGITTPATPPAASTAAAPTTAGASASTNTSTSPSGMTLSETVSADTAQAIPADGTSSLAFDADQETWISVTDSNGKIVFDKILFAGGRESIDVKPPVKITVGNSRATKLSVNGKSMELAPYSRNNIARVKVDAAVTSTPD